MEIGEEKIDNQEMEPSSYAEDDYPAILPEASPPLSIWQLILLFLGGVAVCTIFFAMGFLIGKSQGKMEQMIASGSRSSVLQDVAAQNNPSSTPSQRSASAPATNQGRLEFFDEVNRNAKPESAASTAMEKTQPVADARESAGISRTGIDTANPLKNPAESHLPGGVAPAVDSPAGKTAVAESAGKSDLAAVSSAEKQPPKPKEAKEVYRLQMGAFQTQDEAQNLVLELEAKNFEAFIEPPAGRTDPFYRVQMGPYSSNTKVAEMVSRLKKAGFNAYKKKY